MRADPPTGTVSAPAQGDATAAPPDGPPATAAAADRYELREEIARGGMGVVVRGWDAVLRRDVAVKLLADKYGPDSGAARRFAEEARITGQLQHPAIPPVYDLGALPDGRPFLAMKLIKGRTLAALLGEDDPPRGRLIAAFEQVCQAVAYAHCRGVVHRDLTPANVMVGAFGEIQVMDWGLAKFRAGGGRESAVDSRASTFYDPRADGDDDTVTRAGAVLGTPAYMPPEQAIGAVDQIDERSDVFGLGGLLCAVLTGKPPFLGDTAESTRQLAAKGKVADAFARLDGCGADPGLVALCKRCLAPEPADRPADAAEVARAIAELRAAADERARRAEVDRARAEVAAAEQRKRWRVQAVLVLVAAGSAGVVGGAIYFVRQQWAEQQLRDEARREQDARVRQGVEQAISQLPGLYRRGLWDQAAGALGKAESLLGPDADPGLRMKANTARADLALVRRLDGLRLGKAAIIDGRRRPERVLPRYADAFREAGLDPRAGPVADLAARIRASAVRDYLVAALDDWALTETDPAARRPLFALTAAATGHGWRRALPDAWDDGRRLAAAYDAIPAGERSPGLIVAVAGRLDQLGHDPVAPLAAALLAHPSDFWLHFELAYQTSRRSAGTAVGLYYAAIAVRPDVAVAHGNLGSLLSQVGDPAGAIAHSNEAIRLDPAFAYPHVVLGNVKRAQKKFAEAADHYEAALRRGGPAAGQAWYGLGVVRRMAGDPAGSAAAFREAARLDPVYYAARLRLDRLPEPAPPPRPAGP